MPRADTGSPTGQPTAWRPPGPPGRAGKLGCHSAQPVTHAFWQGSLIALFADRSLQLKEPGFFRVWSEWKGLVARAACAAARDWWLRRSCLGLAQVETVRLLGMGERILVVCLRCYIQYNAPTGGLPQGV
jgi:hypothetical protein